MEREELLRQAAQAGDADTLRVLLADGGIEVDAQDENGQSALHWAASGGYAECVQLLVDANAMLE